MQGNQGHYRVSTSSWAFEPGAETRKTLSDMQHDLMGRGKERREKQLDIYIQCKYESYSGEHYMVFYRTGGISV